ncbi:hypothetical protein [Methylocapsa sp. S129]|uniref:hypothetical protein n=1 Tax=Methylocapsa sp. S129 TaxID=1641869 RepID=UPI00131AAE70|nr:hypothetical protein [Methylocapsa sp. S129]
MPFLAVAATFTVVRLCKPEIECFLASRDQLFSQSFRSIAVRRFDLAHGRLSIFTAHSAASRKSRWMVSVGALRGVKDWRWRLMHIFEQSLFKWIASDTKAHALTHYCYLRRGAKAWRAGTRRFGRGQEPGLRGECALLISASEPMPISFNRLGGAGMSSLGTGDLVPDYDPERRWERIIAAIFDAAQTDCGG